ncbi:hypothetical protein MTP03_25960 [Tsukamurella sp. PLM1]|nr:hypothetical protein MTP03_25960 [Tsukamurella sp. PLM1]
MPHIEVVGGLVEHQHARFLREGAGDQHSLRLASREGAEIPPGKAGSAGDGERTVDRSAMRRDWDAAAAVR